MAKVDQFLGSMLDRLAMNTRRWNRDLTLTILAHVVFAAAAFYFALLFFHIEFSFSFIRNLGVAVTFWAALGLTYNFATVHAPTAAPWFAGLNIIILGASVLLCLVAMVNHDRSLAHAIVIQIVLTLAAAWTLIARQYYASRSIAWHKWFSERFNDDIRVWLIYLFAAYLPFFVPSVVAAVSGHGESGQTFAPAVVEAFSDGITALILFNEFVSFWLDLRRQNEAIEETRREISEADEPDISADVLDEILTSRQIKLGCLYWPPVIDYQKTAQGFQAGGFYGAWVAQVAKAHNLDIICVPVAWHEMKKHLRSRRVDIIPSAFETISRKRYAEFTKHFHQCAMMGVAKNSDKVWDVDTVKAPEVRIVVAKNEVGFEFARTQLGFDPDLHDPHFTVMETSRIEEVVSVVLGGDENYIGIADALSIHALQQQHSNEIRVVLDDPPLETFGVTIMFARGQDRLKAWLEQEFDRARISPDIAAAEKALVERLRPFGFFRKM